MKRHILVDTTGLLFHTPVHPADMQDRDGGVLLLKTLFGTFTLFKNLFTDGGYQGQKFKEGQKKALPSVQTEIVRRSKTAQGFEVLARRWVVERTSKWVGRCRRRAKDLECVNRKALAFLYPASIRLMIRTLCN
jgi:transposase